MKDEKRKSELLFWFVKIFDTIIEENNNIQKFKQFFMNNIRGGKHMKPKERIKYRLKEIIRKENLDWPDWSRLINEIEIYFDLEESSDDEIAFARKDALTNLYDTMNQFGVDLDNKTLNAHYVSMCEHTLYFL